MDDDRKKFPRKNGPKPGGPRGRDDGQKKFGKPHAAGGKPFAKKPFAKRPAEGEAGEKREFRRDDRPRDGEARPERSSAPFRKGPRPEGRPFVKRDGDKPFAKKPFVKRPAEGAAGEQGEKREFRRDDRPRDGAARPERSGAPFRKGPRPEGRPFEKREGKPFEKRDGDKPFVKKPYAKRPSEGGEGEQRPRREFSRDDRPRDGAARPERSGAPFSKGPRPEGRPFEKREGRPFERRDGDAARPPRFERSEGGEARSFRPRRDDAAPRGKSEGFKPRSAEGSKPFARRDEAPVEPGERIAKRLARAGLASRRDAEELIAAGRVKVNNKILTSPAVNVMPNDIIHLDGMEIPPIERTRLFLFHKPSGVVTTNRDPEGRKTVFDVLPQELPRLMTIGRLDINTEGLLLLTNDGGLSRVLELPATGWLRRYRVRVHGKVEQKMLDGLKDGIAVDGVFYGSIEASLDREQGTNAWITIGLREGKNREVKNILGALGLEVTRLIRISYGPFQLGELPEGHVQEVKGRMLREQLGERLVEESGANFDADIVKPFSNRPVGRSEEPREEEAPRPHIVRDGERGRIGEGGLIKNRKRANERHREDVLGRLSNKPDRGKFGDRPKFAGAKKGEREQKPMEPPGGRKANVWMAPGARPQGKGKLAAEEASVAARKASRPAGGRPFDKPRGERPEGGKFGDRPPRGDGPKGPRRGKNDADRRR